MIVCAEQMLLPSAAAGPAAGPGWIEVQGARLARVELGACPRRPDLSWGEGVVTAGLVDVHSHGGGGHSFSDGMGAAREVLRTHRHAGTTSMMASLVSASVDDLVAQTRALAPLVESGELLGIHLEGPWLSRDYRGAHDPDLLRVPTSEDVDRLVPTGQRGVRMVTIAPELPGAIDAIRVLRERGVVVALGHTGATQEETRRAIDAGATVATHLFNGMRPLHHREPGVIAACLNDPRVSVELIADGVHLDPGALMLASRAASGGFLLVSDAMAAAGGDDGHYRLGGLEVDVAEGVARLCGSGSIAGSTLVLLDAVRHLHRETSTPVDESFRAATAAPARVLGLADRGAIIPGGRADLVHVDDQLRVLDVMAAGTVIGGNLLRPSSTA